jgi:hypothetical protein
MPSTESVSHEDLILCACGDQVYKTRDVMDAAEWRGDLAESWQRFLLRIEAEKHADESELDYEDDQIDAAAEAFRYERDLITAEETEQWLSARGLTLDDFGDHFTRCYWGNRLSEDVTAPETRYVDASAATRQLFAAELILSGEIDALTTQLVWRLGAARAEPEVSPEELATAQADFFERHTIEASELPKWLENLGRDLAWFSEMQNGEAAYQHLRKTVLVPNAYRNEVSTLRLPLTRFSTEVVEFESRDAAQEGLFCVTEDGMSMEEVAAEGRYPFRQINFLLEDLSPELQQTFMSVAAGEFIEPIARGDGFELCRIIDKSEPNAEDPAVKERVERRLLARYFDDLAARYVERRLGAVITAE